MANNNFKVWCDLGAGHGDATQEVLDNNCNDGFRTGEQIVAEQMNSILRSTSLVSSALMGLSENNSLNVRSTKDEVATALKKVIFDMTHPVNSIFISTSSANPNSIFGFGTWEPFAEGRTIFGVGQITGESPEGGPYVKSEILPNSKGGYEENGRKLNLSFNNLPSQHKHAIKMNVDGTLKTSTNLPYVTIQKVTAGSGSVYGLVKGTPEASSPTSFAFLQGIDRLTPNINTTNLNVNTEGSAGPIVKQEAIDMTPPYQSVYIWKRVE